MMTRDRETLRIAVAAAGYGLAIGMAYVVAFGAVLLLGC